MRLMNLTLQVGTLEAPVPANTAAGLKAGVSKSGDMSGA